MVPIQYDELHADLCLPVRLRNNRNLTRTGGNKVLVIDDDQMLCRGIDIRLKANNYSSCFAHDAGSALSTALTEMPDLIILDIGLPGHDGYWVMQSFKECPKLTDVPIIVLTALDGFSHQRRCRDAGARRFFQKPVTNLRLMTAIRQLVE